MLIFRHPKYYKELRKLRNKLDQAISDHASTEVPSVRPGPGLKHQATEASSIKPEHQASSLSIKPKHQASSIKPAERQASSD